MGEKEILEFLERLDGKIDFLISGVSTMRAELELENAERQIVGCLGCIQLALKGIQGDMEKFMNKKEN